MLHQEKSKLNPRGLILAFSFWSSRTQSVIIKDIRIEELAHQGECRRLLCERFGIAKAKCVASPSSGVARKEYKLHHSVELLSLSSSNARNITYRDKILDFSHYMEVFFYFPSVS